MSAWNMDIIRRLAGLPAEEPKQLNEGWMDDSESDFGDDEDPDARIAGEDKSQKKFEKKNKKELKAADKESKELSKKPAEKKAEPKKEEPKKAEKKEEPKKEEPKTSAAVKQKKAEQAWAAATKGAAKEEPKKEEPKKAEPEAKKEEPKKVEPAAKTEEPKKEEPKKEEPKKEVSAEAKRRGRAQNENSGHGKARAWMDANPGHTYSQFKKAMIDAGHMTKNGATTFYYGAGKRHKAAQAGKKVDEVFFIQHPYMSGYLLAENRELNKFDWIDADSKFEPLVYDNLTEAQKMIKYMSEWKGQPCKLFTLVFEDEQVSEGQSYETIDDAADCHMDAHVNGDTAGRARAEREITHRFGDGALEHVKKRSAAFAARAAKDDVGAQSKAEAADHLARARLAVKK